MSRSTRLNVLKFIDTSQGMWMNVPDGLVPRIACGIKCRGLSMFP
jgi:hypothetical protein